MRREPIVIALFVVGCGGVSDRHDLPDASHDASAPDTTVAGNPRCNPTGPFQAPTPMPALDSNASDEGAWLSPDELTIYFDSTRTGTLGAYDIFMATRASRDAAWEHVMPVMGVNDAGHQRGPNVTADGLTLYALIGSAPNYDIGRATRSSPSATFGPLVPVAELNTSSNDETASIAADGSSIYISSNRSGTYKIYRSRLVAGKFQPPAPISGVDLDGAYNDSGAVVSADELAIYFSSDRPGGVGSGDIWMATRATTADAFGPAVNVQVFNTAGLDGITWLSADGCVAYLNRGPCCSYDLSVATRGL